MKVTKGQIYGLLGNLLRMNEVLKVLKAIRAKSLRPLRLWKNNFTKMYCWKIKTGRRLNCCFRKTSRIRVWHRGSWIQVDVRFYYQMIF